MTRTVLVTGGSGTLGRALVARLGDGDDVVRVLSRRPRPADTGWATGDLVTGRGLAAAVAGAPGAIAAGYRAGHNLAPEHPYGSITFEQFLGASP